MVLFLGLEDDGDGGSVRGVVVVVVVAAAEKSEKWEKKEGTCLTWGL